MSKSIEIIRRVVSTDHVDLPAASVDAVAARVASYMNVADDVEPPEFEVRSALRIIHLSQNSLFKAPPTSSYVFDLLKAERESNGLRITGERRIELHRMVEVMSVAEREATVARMSQDVITKVRRDAAERRGERLASALTAPARTCGSSTAPCATIRSTWPETRSCIAGPAPR